MKWVLILVVVGVAIWWFQRDPVEVAYEKCLARVSEEMTPATPNANAGAAEKAMADAVKSMGAAMGSTVCDAIRTACRSDRDSAICKAALAQF